jgi:stress response protein YsnF
VVSATIPHPKKPLFVERRTTPGEDIMQDILSKLRGWKLDDQHDDVRGWLVKDRQGHSYGRVAELVVDTDEKHVTELVLADGRRLPAHDISVGDHELLLEPQVSERVTELEEETRETEGTREPREQAALDFAHGDDLRREEVREKEEVLVPLVAEEVEFGKRSFEKGTTRVRVRVIEQPFEQTLALREESVSVERRKVDESLTADEADTRLQDRTVEVFTVTEEPVIEKHARVLEEVVLAKKVEERSEHLREVVRRTTADILDISPASYQPVGATS